MAGIDEILERLITDPGFKEQLATDPASALAGYDLTEDDLTLLASQVDSAGGLGAVEQRTSKSGFAGLLSSVADSIKWAGPPDREPGGGPHVRVFDVGHPDSGAGDDYILTDAHHEAGIQGGVFVAAGDLDGGEPGDGTITIKGSTIEENRLKQIPLAATGYVAQASPPPEPSVASYPLPLEGVPGGIGEPEQAGSGGSLPVESVSINFEPVKPAATPVPPEPMRKDLEEPMKHLE